jgi:hypothetical protein
VRVSADLFQLEEEIRRPVADRDAGLKQLEDENAKLKRLVADLSLDKKIPASGDPKNGPGLYLFFRVLGTQVTNRAVLLIHISKGRTKEHLQTIGVAPSSRTAPLGTNLSDPDLIVEPRIRHCAWCKLQGVVIDIAQRR